MAGARRNVLLVTADQWRGDCLSAVGHRLLETPNFDALAADGVLFPRHYSVCAPCGPSRASLLTGMYMHNHRSVRNGTPLADGFTNIAREVRKAGYRPLLFGYTDTSLDPGAHAEEDVIRHGYESLMPGFEEGLLLPGERPQAWIDYLALRGYAVQSYEEAFAFTGDPPAGAGRASIPALYRSEDSQTAFLAERVVEYLDRADPGWFVHLSWFRPHPPYIAPAPWNTRYDPATVPAPVRSTTPAAEASIHPWLAAVLGAAGNWPEAWMREPRGTPRYDGELRALRATYYGLVGKVDYYFGRIMEFLKARGWLDSTLVVLTSDHGELLGDHYLFGKRGWFDPAFHIPLIVRDPFARDADRNRVADTFSESVDVMPTILEWLGLETPRQCDGRSLVPFLRGGVGDAADEVHFEYDIGNDGEGVDARDILGLAYNESLIGVLRTRDFKYVHFAGLEPLLFDLRRDPGELANVAREDGYRDTLLGLAQRMLSWRMSTEAAALTHLHVSREGLHESPGRRA